VPQFLLNFRPYAADDAARALLALLEDFSDAIVLLAAEVQLVVYAVKEFASSEPGRRHQLWRRSLRPGEERWSRLLTLRALNFVHQHASGNNARGENNNGCQNDFPGTHHASPGSSAAANTADSRVTGSDSFTGHTDHTLRRIESATHAAAARQSALPQSSHASAGGADRNEAITRFSKAYGT
jgi:hypothetical protein